MFYLKVDLEHKDDPLTVTLETQTRTNLSLKSNSPRVEN